MPHADDCVADDLEYLHDVRLVRASEAGGFAAPIQHFSVKANRSGMKSATSVGHYHDN